MGKITFVIGILLLAMLFQKNPVWGMFALGIYILFKVRSRRYNSSRGLIMSGEKNTANTIFAMRSGFQTIADAIKGEDSVDVFDNEKNPSGYFKKNIASMDMYKN